MNKTTAPKVENIKREWHYIDASDQVLGRLAEKVAVLIMGKHKPDFAPNQNMGDVVVITNASKITITGNKLRDKKYYWHTGFPGAIKSKSLGKVMETKPEEALTKAVKGMLPRNRLQSLRMNNLHIYAGKEHPHQAQEK